MPRKMACTSNQETFEVFVAKEAFKFNAAHFIAYKGYRERLHGHNYRASVRIRGQLGPDGYVVDFGDIKKVTTKVCKALNEHFICPAESDCLAITTASGNVRLRCEDGTEFSFPERDVKMLPIRHSSAEELAQYMSKAIVEEFGLSKLRARGATEIEVGVAEAPWQEARYCVQLDSAVFSDEQTTGSKKRSRAAFSSAPSELESSRRPTPCRFRSSERFPKAATNIRDADVGSACSASTVESDGGKKRRKTQWGDASTDGEGSGDAAAAGGLLLG